MEIERLSKGGIHEWERFYKTKLSHSIFDLDRFSLALQEYGAATMYEAIIITSLRKLTEDPFGYVLAVAHSKWKEQIEELNDSARYQMRIEQSKDISAERNDELRRKIEKAKERKHERRTL